MSEQAHVQSFTNKAFAEHIAVGDKDEACTSYCALQESAAVQILLDVCLTQQEDKVCSVGVLCGCVGVLCAVCSVCSVYGVWVCCVQCVGY